MYSLHIESTPSIESFVKRVKSYTKDIQEKQDALLERLANIGADAVRRAYAATDHVGDAGEPSVYAYKSMKGWSIFAFGAEVLFIEFGTGDMAGNGYTENYECAFNISPGSYSSTEGTGEYAKYGSWHHKKRKYTYSTPAKGFVEAKAEILRQAPQVAKEIFGK